MPQTYTITQISPKEPRAWDGPHGTIFYTDVKVAEHERPISIGKKQSGTLKVGDEIYGTITRGDHDVDKFKAEQNPNFGGGSKPNGNFGSPTSKAGSPEQQESIARSVALKAAVDFYGNVPFERKNNDVLLQTADEFLTWLQGSGAPATKLAEPGLEKARAQVEAMKQRRDERDEFNDARNREPLPTEPDDFDPNEIPF